MCWWRACWCSSSPRCRSGLRPPCRVRARRPWAGRYWRSSSRSASSSRGPSAGGGPCWRPAPRCSSAYCSC
ncbi:hypothetical protein ACFFX0_15900 [Citricoccus parietis]|uniref:Secreted protein n=1 Tax=Citricoccus parietis TaxID=592307 RepID=A0ABV5G0Z2_9MICC